MLEPNVPSPPQERTCLAKRSQQYLQPTSTASVRIAQIMAGCELISCSKTEEIGGPKTLKTSPRCADHLQVLKGGTEKPQMEEYSNKGKGDNHNLPLMEDLPC